jgi:hypothetical protein
VGRPANFPGRQRRRRLARRREDRQQLHQLGGIQGGAINITSVAIQNGAINITFGNKANNVILGKVLTLRPAVVEDAPIVPVTWVCGYATAPEKMTVKGENQTNIPPGLLPIRCRS